MEISGKRGTRQIGVLIALMFLLSLLLSCTETAGYPAGMAPTPTMLWTGLPSDDARVELYAQQILAQQEQQAINATLAAVYAQQTATAEAIAATATARAWDATATVEAQRATATAVAWRTTTEAAYAYATATAQAQQIQATATAAAYIVQTTATAQVAGTATARADQAARATATVEAIYFQATTTAVAAQQASETAMRAEQIRREQLATQREEIVYPVRAYGPWVILAAVVLLILWGGYGVIKAYTLRLRVIQRDERGDAPLILLEQRRAIGLFDSDKGFWPALVFGRDGQVQQPQLAPPELQERVTMRDQTIDAVTRGLPGNATRRPAGRRAAQIIAQQPPPAITGPVQIVEPQQVRGWLRDVTPQALRNVLQSDHKEPPNDREGSVLDVEVCDDADFER